jgi:hypothetical protein
VTDPAAVDAEQTEEVAQYILRPAELLAEYGVVTLADHNYFEGMLLLHQSIQEDWPVHLVCFDLGLTEAQRAAAQSLSNLTILPLPENPLIELIRAAFSDTPPLAKVHKKVWPLWICPALIAAAPFRRVFWLDSDLVILRRLADLFMELDRGPVFTPENLAPQYTPNKPALYQYLPISRPFDAGKPVINAGVSGWDLDRDLAILEAYLYPVVRAVFDPLVRGAISWHDQGALIWAIQRSGLEDRVMDTPMWNLCVRNSSVFKKQIPWNPDFLDAVRQSEPAASILHWNGVSPPWAAARAWQDFGRGKAWAEARLGPRRDLAKDREPPSRHGL